MTSTSFGRYAYKLASALPSAGFAFDATGCRRQCSCRYARRERDHRNRRPDAAGPAALGAVSHARHRRARHYLGARWARGDDRRLNRRRAGRKPGAAFHARPSGLVATAYLAGAVIGALLFGYLTDRLGRRKL